MVNNETDCLFCKIIKKDIPANIIYENEHVIVFLDIMPVVKGHCLVVPKRHSDTLLVMDDRDVAETFKAARHIAEASMKSLGAKGFNLKMNNFKVAGQIVPHAHVHILPRFEGDDLKDWHGEKADPKVLSDISKEIRRKL